MKKTFLLLIIFGVVSCSIINPYPTSTPIPTSTQAPTDTPAPTNTPYFTPIPVEYFTYETGWCFSLFHVAKSPRDSSCTRVDSKQVDLNTTSIGISISSSSSTSSNPLRMYCALFDMSGKLVDFEIQKKSNASISCSFHK